METEAKHTKALSLHSTKLGRKRPDVGEGAKSEHPCITHWSTLWWHCHGRGAAKAPLKCMEVSPFLRLAKHILLKDCLGLYLKQPSYSALVYQELDRNSCSCLMEQAAPHRAQAENWIFHSLPIQISSADSFFPASWMKSLADPSLFFSLL